MRDFLRGKRQRPAISAKPRGQFGENARNFDEFFFGELDQPIVQIYSFQRLDEDGLPRSAGSVNHTGNSATVRGTNRNHETIAAQRYVVLRGRSTASENAFERSPNLVATLADADADAPQLRRGIITDFAIGKNGAANGGRKMAKIREGCGARSKFWVVRTVGLESLASGLNRIH